jgi:hypothetical protein
MPRKSVPAIPEKPTGGGEQPERSRADPKALLKEPPPSVVQLDLLDSLANFGREQAGLSGTSLKPRQGRARHPGRARIG